MQACRGLVLPSYMEGMPRVVLEAMDLGVPVVASSIPGIRAIDPKGLSIRFHNPGDQSSLAESILAVLQRMATWRIALHVGNG